MCQEHVESPAVYSAVLHENLKGFYPLCDSKLVQYVDDLLLCSKSKQACQADTVAPLQYLHAQSHKASLSKLQWVKEEITLPGRIISHDG